MTLKLPKTLQHFESLKTHSVNVWAGVETNLRTHYITVRRANIGTNFFSHTQRNTKAQDGVWRAALAWVMLCDVWKESRQTRVTLPSVLQSVLVMLKQNYFQSIALCFLSLNSHQIIFRDLKSEVHIVLNLSLEALVNIVVQSRANYFRCLECQKSHFAWTEQWSYPS